MWIEAFWEGALAGYGIAIPVGAIAVLIIELGIRCGMRAAFLAGAGAATADFLYAALAAWLGSTAAAALTPYEAGLRWISGVALLAIGSYGLGRSFRRASLEQSPAVGEGSGWYWRFLLLTLMNPLTVAYFAALILGRGGSTALDGPQRLAFMAGAGLSSLSWQSLLALTGALAHRRFSPRARWLTALLGNGVVIAFGVRVLASV